MPLISADQIIGKTLIAKNPVSIYALPDKDKRVGIVEPGKPVGVVYSFVGGKGGAPLFWQFYAKAGGIEKAYYAEHKDDAFNLPALKEQGVKTTQQIVKEKEEQDKPTSDKIFEFVKKYAIWAGVGLGAFLLFREVIRKK
jgi:hypothetical protein